jgi:hypothetical protein
MPRGIPNKKGTKRAKTKTGASRKKARRNKK